MTRRLKARAARTPSLACLLVPVVRGCVSAPEQDKAHDKERRDRDTDADKGKRRQGEHRVGQLNQMLASVQPLPLHSGDLEG